MRRKLSDIYYRKTLETAARGMIEILDHNKLIRLIVHMLVREVKVKHAGVLLLNKEKNCYILNVSRGEPGFKIPVGYAKLNVSSPIIKFFSERKNYLISRTGAISRDILYAALKDKDLIKKYKDIKALILAMLDQMDTYNAEVCVPSYFHKSALLGVLILGKKGDGARFIQKELGFLIVLAEDAAMAIRNAQLFKELKNEVQERTKLYEELLKRTRELIGSLAETVSEKDSYTDKHLEQVEAYGIALAEELRKDEGIDIDIEKLSVSLRLHDIGKIAIPDSILNKPGKLTPEEWVVMKQHPEAGARILEHVEYFRPVAEIIRSHQEKYDGTGYPRGLKGEQIPIEARIISVVDAYHAMTSKRPYRDSMASDHAVDELAKNSGTQFDAKIVNAFLIVLKRWGIIPEPVYNSAKDIVWMAVNLQMSNSAHKVLNPGP